MPKCVICHEGKAVSNDQRCQSGCRCVVHGVCLEKWRLTSNLCILCRKPVPLPVVHKVPLYVSFILRIIILWCIVTAPQRFWWMAAGQMLAESAAYWTLCTTEQLKEVIKLRITVIGIVLTCMIHISDLHPTSFFISYACMALVEEANILASRQSTNSWVCSPAILLLPLCDALFLR